MSAFWWGYRCGTLAVFFGWASWLCYGVGHVGYLICDRCGDDDEEPGPIFRATFRTYQSGMAWSYRIQEWIEGGVYCRFLPWGPKSTPTAGSKSER